MSGTEKEWGVSAEQWRRGQLAGSRGGLSGAQAWRRLFRPNCIGSLTVLRHLHLSVFEDFNGLKKIATVGDNGNVNTGPVMDLSSVRTWRGSSYRSCKK
jgi:hypothetical protein